MEPLGHACWELGHIDGAVTHIACAFADTNSSIGLRKTAGIKSLYNLSGHQRLAGHTKAAEESLQTALSTVDDVFRLELFSRRGFETEEQKRKDFKHFSLPGLEAVVVRNVSKTNLRSLLHLPLNFMAANS